MPTYDPANFDKDRLQVIWGTYPACLVSRKKQAWEFHHCQGRGAEFGAGLKHPKRKIFSSCLNAVPISRDSHDNEALRNRSLRIALLAEVRRKVMAAVEAGLIELTDTDKAFLRFVDLWLQEPNGYKLLERV